MFNFHRKIPKVFWVFLSLFVIIFYFGFSRHNIFAVTGVPEILSQQGRLLDASGNLLGGSSGTNYCFRFSIYDASSGGAKLWPSGTPSTMTVSVVSGVFSVGIGDTSAGGDTLDFNFQDNDTVYLNVEVENSSGGSCAGVTFGSEDVLAPRQRIFSAGYAINANTVLGFTPSQSAGASQIPVLNSSGNLVFGGTLDLGGIITAGSSNINLTLATGFIDADALTLTIAADGGTGTSSGSGLITRSDGIGLLQGCANNEILKWVESTDTWDCATDSTSAGAGVSTIQENDVTIDGSATTIDFLGSDFVVTSSPAGEANISIDYPNSLIARKNQIESITSNWIFGTNVDLVLGAGENLSVTSTSAGTADLFVLSNTGATVTTGID
ncbi:MAG: hypothetical protein AAB877_02060, partial [Patescibacteria group bacterium]